MVNQAFRNTQSTTGCNDVRLGGSDSYPSCGNNDKDHRDIFISLPCPPNIRLSVCFVFWKSVLYFRHYSMRTAVSVCSEGNVTGASLNTETLKWLLFLRAFSSWTVTLQIFLRPSALLCSFSPSSLFVLLSHCSINRLYLIFRGTYNLLTHTQHILLLSEAAAQ